MKYLQKIVLLSGGCNELLYYSWACLCIGRSCSWIKLSSSFPAGSLIPNLPAFNLSKPSNCLNIIYLSYTGLVCVLAGLAAGYLVAKKMKEEENKKLNNTAEDIISKAKKEGEEIIKEAKFFN